MVEDKLTHTYMHERAHTHTGPEKNSCVCVCTFVHVCLFFPPQNAEPEGCCASAVCIVYCVVPQRVCTGDGHALRPRSTLLIIYSDWIRYYYRPGACY